MEAALQAALAAGEIAYDREADGWRVTGFRIARAILGDDAFRKPDFAPLALDALPPALAAAVRRGETLQRLWTVPPPEAAWPVRRTFAAAFAPRRIGYLREAMGAEAERLLAGAEGDGFDLDRDFAQPLTEWAIARLYGIDPAEIGRVAQMSGPLATAFSFGVRDRIGAAMAMATIEPVLTALLRAPSRGGAAALETVQAAMASGEISADEALSWMALSLLGGLQTNRRFLVQWLSRPAPPEGETGNSDASWLQTAAELARRNVVVDSIARQSRCPLALDAAAIPAGATFLLDLERINHDPARAEGSHLSFGHGAHMCIGRHLAMMQIESAGRVVAGWPAARRASLALAAGPMSGAAPH
ncbi:cytochrome P450 [Sphingomonas sp. LB-2]|uniref:cytochrome P450 n=1 Tax=Sphingomonas caeni TaxID=2984949 RepID=UPI002231D6F4|nr:cytochrome P450 [Sphingomonas caeni]MCW3846667.1 cytochrome P450 [Sphingomonas caeni]